MSIETEIQRLQTAKADIKTAIEEKGVEVGDGLIDTYAEKIAEISSGGDVIDFAKYAKAFRFATDEGLPEDLTIYFENMITLEYFWENIPNEYVKHITLNMAKKIISMTGCFNRTSNAIASVLEHITLNADTSSVKGWSQAFYLIPNLKVIDGTPLDLSSSTSLGWSWCTSPNLEEIRIVENTIPKSLTISSGKLSRESKASIFNGLARVETAQALTLNANLKILQSQVDSANEKGWTVAGGIVVSEEEYYA